MPDPLDAVRDDPEVQDLRGYADGLNETEALRESLRGTQWRATRYAVLDWSQAKFFSSTPSFTEEP